MAVPKIKALHFLTITSRSKLSQSSSPLDLYIQYSDVPKPDFTPQNQQFPVITGPRRQGEAIAVSLTMPSNLYYVMRATLIIKGNDLWLPKTLAIYAEDTTGYVYPLMEFMNWPDKQNTTWSTDLSEGYPEIQIFPLLLPGG